MLPETKTPAAREEPVAGSAPEFYFPAGGGTDPDFPSRANGDDAPGPLTRWWHGPLTGRRNKH